MNFDGMSRLLVNRVPEEAAECGEFAQQVTQNSGHGCGENEKNAAHRGELEAEGKVGNALLSSGLRGVAGKSWNAVSSGGC